MWNSVFDLLLLAASVFSFSLSKSLPSTTDSMTVDMSSLNYMDDELQKLKDLMRSRAPSINSLTRLNVTLGVKRKLVRQYRQKLLELNELSTDAPEQIHRRDYHSYTAMAGRINIFHFTLNCKVILVMAEPSSIITALNSQHNTVQLQTKRLDH